MAGEGGSKLEIDLENFRPVSPESVIQALEEEARTKIVAEMVGIAVYHRAQFLAEEITAHIVPTQDEITTLRKELSEGTAEVAQSQAALDQVRRDLYRERNVGPTVDDAVVERLEEAERASRSRVVNAKSVQRSAEVRYREASDKLEGIRCLVRSLEGLPKPTTETLAMILDAVD